MAEAKKNTGMAGADFVIETLRTTSDLLSRMAADAALCAATAMAADAVVSALRRGNKLLLCGNGGSAADAQHWAGELVSRFHYDRPGLAAIALTTDSSIMSGIGNDYGYERVFSRQVEALGAAGDVLFALSTSGRSPNILAALKAARDKGLATIGFTGEGGGDMPPLCDILLRVPHPSTPRVQEGHEVLGHAICAMVEATMFPRGD
jgi:D-sedoheptulose 7-phosphate isomerase